MITFKSLILLFYLMEKRVTEVLVFVLAFGLILLLSVSLVYAFSFSDFWNKNRIINNNRLIDCF